MNVLLVTTWNTACGIAEHSALLKEHVEAADPEIRIIPSPESLDPWSPRARALLYDPAYYRGEPLPDVVHLNYQAALHSRWGPANIGDLQDAGRKVMVTYHDTGVPNSDQCKAIVDAADVTVVHEPAEDLPAEKIRYWRMGVPCWPKDQYVWGREVWWKAWFDQPVLGSIGFPFPWKNYDKLAEITAACGWALYLIAPNATTEQIVSWQKTNPSTHVVSGFMDRTEAIRHLAACDATAFMYTCANTGQSGAILQGIAARKPVIALSTCRQNRALYGDPLGLSTIRWCESFETLALYLKHSITLERVDCGVVALAEQESWTKLGAKYAALYRELLG